MKRLFAIFCINAPIIFFASGQANAGAISEARLILQAATQIHICVGTAEKNRFIIRMSAHHGRKYGYRRLSRIWRQYGQAWMAETKEFMATQTIIKCQIMRRKFRKAGFIR